MTKYNGDELVRYLVALASLNPWMIRASSASSSVEDIVRRAGDTRHWGSSLGRSRVREKLRERLPLCNVADFKLCGLMTVTIIL